MRAHDAAVVQQGSSSIAAWLVALLEMTGVTITPVACQRKDRQQNKRPVIQSLIKIATLEAEARCTTGPKRTTT